MAETSAGRIYAQALFNLARRRDQVAEYGRALSLLAETVEPQRDFRIFLAAPMVPRAKREEAAAALAQALDLPGPVARLFQVAVDRRRAAELSVMAREYAELEDSFFGRIDVEAVSAAGFSVPERERLEKALADLLGKNIRMKYEEDPNLVAGILVKAGGKVFDCSLAGRLARLKEKMMSREASPEGVS